MADPFCECIYHRNVKLILNGGDINFLTTVTNMQFSSNPESLRMIMWHRSFNVVFFVQVQVKFMTIFDKNQVTRIQFEQGVSTNGFAIAIQVLHVNHFVDSLYNTLDMMYSHF